MQESASVNQVARELIVFAWPVVGVNLLQFLSLAVDTAMVGRVSGAEAALVGMAYATQVVYLTMVGMVGLTVGAVAIISRAHGSGDASRKQKVLQQALQLTVALGVLTSIVGNLVGVPVLSALGAEGANLDQAMAYLTPTLTFASVGYLNILLAATLRGVGDTRLAFAVGIFSNVLNIGLNYGLILGNFGFPALGVQGAAIGTVLSQAFSVLLLMVLLRRGRVPGLTVILAAQPIDREMARSLFRIGWPAAADIIVLNVGLLAVVGMLARVDPLAVAAHGIGIRIQSLAFVPAMSLGHATAAMVGAALGAGDSGRATAICRASVRLAFAMMGTLGVATYVLAPQLIALFDVSPGAMYDFTVTWLEVLAVSMPAVGVSMSLSGLLQGAGASSTSMRINAWATIVVQIPLGFILAFVFGLGPWGVWFAIPLAYALKCVWAHAEFRRGAWSNPKWVQ